MSDRFVVKVDNAQGNPHVDIMRGNDDAEQPNHLILRITSCKDGLLVETTSKVFGVRQGARPKNSHAAHTELPSHDGIVLGALWPPNDDAPVFRCQCGQGAVQRVRLVDGREVLCCAKCFQHTSPGLMRSHEPIG